MFLLNLVFQKDVIQKYVLAYEAMKQLYFVRVKDNHIILSLKCWTPASICSVLFPLPSGNLLYIWKQSFIVSSSRKIKG